MPRPNFSKLKASSSRENGSTSSAKKKQATISRFFSSTAKPQKNDSNADVLEDAPMSVKEKQSSPVKVVKVQSSFRKRNASSSPEGQNPVQDPSKRLKLNSSDTCTSSSAGQCVEQGESSKTIDSSGSQSHLSVETRTRLNTFQATPNRTRSTTSSDVQSNRKIENSSNLSSSKSSTDGSNTSGSSKDPCSQDSGIGSTSSPRSSGESSSRTISSIKDAFSYKGKSTSTGIKDKPVSKATSSKLDYMYTPLEKQYMEIKEQYADALLFVECGYRYRFFGEDAEIAAKELNIYCHLDHNFMVASIPVHRLFVHARRLVAKGYKVGVVKQTETAALKKAGDNRNAPFKRKLTALYTKSTMIGEDLDPSNNASDASEGEVELSSSSYSSSNYLLCVSEFLKKGTKTEKPENVQFGLVAVQPATGDIVYDCFHDNSQLSELDTRLHHIQPVELLVAMDISDKADKLLRDFSTSSPRDDDRVRIERMASDNFEHSAAFEEVSAFYKSCADETSQEVKEQSQKVSDRLQQIINLPVPVICCLAALLKYLKEFKLHRVLKEASNFTPFSAATQVMKLNACALRNLEIFKNQTDGSSQGSLFWVLNHTSTKFGSRMLHKWLSQPLMDAGLIHNRQEAISEILESDSQALATAKDLLIKAPDIEKGLCSIYHKKCSTAEFVTVVKCLHRISTSLVTVQSMAESQLKSDLLKTVFTQVPALLEGMKSYLDAVDEKAAKDGDKTKLFVDTSSFPAVKQCQEDIEGVIGELRDHRREVRKVLRQPSLDYITVSGLEFLVEVKNKLLKEVPNDWTKISSTKQVSRFHSPFIVEAYKRLSQLREQLVIECQHAWLKFLDLFGEQYFAYRQAIQHLASLDCLFSLAKVAAQEGYTKPEMFEDTMCIDIENGRHPIVSALLSGEVQFVPNSTHMEADKQRCMIITGPNMGGKSSYIKQVALICIMTQIGSYVPADSAKMGILDAVYTRMGASDNIYQNRSTFMVELSEASDIISHATRHSLIILDELGRGTSTHDGVAIAYATARHFISEVQCLMLFVTHYPPLADLERLFPSHVANYHMSFLLHDKEEDGSDDGVDVITFLYQLVRGMAAKSYGLNVAKLATIPSSIIKVADGKAHELETTVMATRGRNVALRQLWKAPAAEIASTVNNLTRGSGHHQVIP
ncbi:DNA mismatch repair protein Msh3-like [Amphiura filiformis]|uniref:DNA mismatch repair protein Msh3-like n=1 Tax=Amphiura filiformis TaxID=82378 RepID=UPI003B214668